MATTYTADAAAAAAVGEDMQSASRSLQNIVDELNTTLKSNLADWDDDAKNAYNAAQAKWNAASANMWTQLNASEQALTSIMQGYTRATNSGVQVFS